MRMSVEEQMDQILSEYMEDVEEGTDEAAGVTAKATVRLLKKTSPKGKSKIHYRAGWTVEKGGKMERTVWNKKKPGLTHLLNNGHVIANQFGEYGRKEGDNHIGDAADWAPDNFVKEVVRRI